MDSSTKIIESLAAKQNQNSSKAASKLNRLQKIKKKTVTQTKIYLSQRLRYVHLGSDACDDKQNAKI